MMGDQQPLTEEQNSTIQDFCKNIDDILAKFKKSPSLKRVKFADDVNVFRRISNLVDGIAQGAIMEYLLSRDEVFQILKLIWDSPVERKDLRDLSLGIGNLTDWSDEFCSALGEKGLLKLVMQNLGENKFVDSRKNSALVIIYNCCRRVLENRVICREYIGTLEECTKSESKHHQADAFLALSYIVDKSEVHKISLNEPCLEFLLLALKSAMSASDRRSRGYLAFEILHGINQLAINDSNKLLIVELGGIDELEGVLDEERSNNEEKMWAARAIWRLAFKEENKVKIRQRTKLLNTLKQIKETSDDDEVIDACSGALFVISEVLDIDDAVKGHSSYSRDREDVSGHSSAKSGASADRVEGHIMISYQHSNQERVLQVKRYLEECGYNVWMDVEKMKGDILGGMATAVQNAAVVLVCMSRNFKDSRHCRTEATYAYTLNQDIVPLKVEDKFKPNDWLGALIGMKKYFSIYSDDVMSSSLPKLVRELGDRGKLCKSDLVVPLLDELRGASSPFIHCPVRLDDTNEDEVDGSGGIKDDKPTDNKDEGNSRLEKMDDVASWDEEETGEWLKSHGVETSKGSFKRVNGTRLKQIKKLLQVAPDFCLKSLKDELCIDLWDVLSLVDALEKL